MLSVSGLSNYSINLVIMTTSMARPLNRLPGKRLPLSSSSSAAAAGATGGSIMSSGASSSPFTGGGASAAPVTLQTPLGSTSRDGKIQLQILTQPEQQHRARYQTEGSRGAVKDRSGNGFPVVRLLGHTKPTVLQVFIGTDVGRVAPHMFYQACKVSGKNSTPCVERKLEGTMVIEVDMKPENDMTVTCDCVGILKERNVDVEHRFPDQSGPRAKKKSTRCRMVFRALVTHDNGNVETVQVCSQQIVCTQPPGVPEICKKSLVSCPVEGGLDLFIIGKNFLKDTKVIFQRRKSSSPMVGGAVSVMPWEQIVIPDKEFLQQTHLICTVPPYVSQDIVEPVVVTIYVQSAGKRSEPHNFTYTPKSYYSTLTGGTAGIGSPPALGVGFFSASSTSTSPLVVSPVSGGQTAAALRRESSPSQVSGGESSGSGGNFTTINTNFNSTHAEEKSEKKEQDASKEN